MTFEEWFEQEFWQIDEDERFVGQMRRAWEAGYNEGYDDASADAPGECPPEFRRR